MRTLTAGWIAFALWPLAGVAVPSDPPPADAKSPPATQAPPGVWAPMDASITRQRTAVCHQVRAPEAAGLFFILPPPDPLRPILAFPGTAAPDCAALADAELKPLVEEAARLAGVEPAWLASVVSRKSGGVPCAISPSGAQGLMQLMPATALELGVADPFNARENLAAGARRLKQLLDRAGGDQAGALALYDADPGPKRPGEASATVPGPVGSKPEAAPVAAPAVAATPPPAVPNPAPPASPKPTPAAASAPPPAS